MNSQIASLNTALGEPFTLKVTLLHNSETIALDEKRAALVSECERVSHMAFRVCETFSAGPSDSHFYLAHDSESGHQKALDGHCEPDGAYYVLFSRSLSEIKRCKRRGLLLPANIVESRAVAFLKQWIRTQQFPGWEYLIGEPERDSALEYLHQRLAGENGCDAWGRVEDLCLPGEGDDCVKELLGRLKEKHTAGSQDLHEMRDLLLNADGLVARLVKLRRGLK